MIAAAIFGSLACLSFILLVWQLVCALRFPLHQRAANPRYSPDMSILKPLKGADTHTRACLESWMTQNYEGRIQILFGVHSPDDPVCVLVRELIVTHPTVDAELVICPKMLGPNAKISTLIQLQSLAKYETIAISDADIRAPHDFLTQAVAQLQNERVGLVNCFYELKAESAGLAIRCEQFLVNADFWSQVLQAKSLKPLDFALGAVMITTSTRLRQIGAFPSLVDYLADDYQLGNRIAKSHGEIVISSIVVESWSPNLTAAEVWRHQLRWARTIRVSQPAPYFFSILNDVTLWSFLFVATSPAPGLFGIVFLLARFGAALLLEWKLTRRWALAAGPIALCADLVRPLIWALAFLGNTVTWRGETYRVLRGGKLISLARRNPGNEATFSMKLPPPDRQ